MPGMSDIHVWGTGLDNLQVGGIRIHEPFNHKTLRVVSGLGRTVVITKATREYNKFEDPHRMRARTKRGYFKL